VAVGGGIHLRVGLLGDRIAAAAVEVEHDRQTPTGLGTGGHVGDVFARPAVELDRELLVARRQLIGIPAPAPAGVMTTPSATAPPSQSQTHARSRR
jgi:hypothetical protein